MYLCLACLLTLLTMQTAQLRLSNTGIYYHIVSKPFKCTMVLCMGTAVKAVIRSLTLFFSDLYSHSQSKLSGHVFFSEKRKEGQLCTIINTIQKSKLNLRVFLQVFCQ